MDIKWIWAFVLCVWANVGSALQLECGATYFNRSSEEYTLAGYLNCTGNTTTFTGCTNIAINGGGNQMDASQLMFSNSDFISIRDISLVLSGWAYFQMVNNVSIDHVNTSFVIAGQTGVIFFKATNVSIQNSLFYQPSMVYAALVLSAINLYFGNNHVSAGAPISLQTSSQVVMEDNTLNYFVNRVNAAAVLIGSVHGFVFQNNHISKGSLIGSCADLTIGIQVSRSTGLLKNNTIDDIFSTDCLVSPYYMGIFITQESTVTIDGGIITLPHHDAAQYYSSVHLYAGFTLFAGIQILGSNVSISNIQISDFQAPRLNYYTNQTANGSVFDICAIAIQSNSGQHVNLTNVSIDGVYGGSAENVQTSENQTMFGGGSAYGIYWDSGDLTLDSVSINGIYGGNGVSLNSIQSADCAGGEARLIYEGGSGPLQGTEPNGIFQSGQNCTNPFGPTPAPTPTPQPVLNATCAGNNGGCDYRLLCDDSTGIVDCSSCPNGTYGNSSKCLLNCNNEVCEPEYGENCVTCPFDCVSVLCDVCGDGHCNATSETCSSCYQDCGPCETPACERKCDHGTCNEKGVCECSDTWTGPFCSSRSTAPASFKYNNTNTQVTQDNANFLISIKSITEMNGNTPLRSVVIENINFTPVTLQSGPNTIHNYTANLENGAILSVVLWQFGEDSTQDFAGVTSKFPANSLKMSVSIQNWPFYLLANSLAINMQAVATDNLQKPVSACVNYHENDGNLLWYVVVVDKVTLYGQFLDKAVIDGRVRTISNVYDPANSTITAILPHFWDFADMDPQFSFLLDDPTAGGDKCSHKKNQTKKIVEIVVPIVVVLILLAAIFVIFWPRFDAWWKSRKHSRVLSGGSSDGIDLETEKPGSRASYRI